MKKSNLGVPKIVAEDVEAACNILRSNKEEIIKAVPYLNLNAVVDHVTHEIVDYEPVGDPTNGKLETKTFRIMGQEIPFSIMLSKFKDNSGNIVREDKTLNYDESKMVEIIETAKNLFEMCKFFHEYVTPKLRGLLPESIQISQFDTNLGKPLFGKPWIDYMVGNYGNIKDIKTISTMAHADSFLSGFFNLQLTQYMMIFDTLLEATNHLQSVKPASTTVINNEPFNPGVYVDNSVIVNTTEINKPVDRIETKLNSITGLK